MMDCVLDNKSTEQMKRAPSTPASGVDRSSLSTARLQRRLAARERSAVANNTDNTVNTAQIGKRKCTPSTHNGHFEFTRNGHFESRICTMIASRLHLFAPRGFTQFAFRGFIPFIHIKPANTASSLRGHYLYMHELVLYHEPCGSRDAHMPYMHIRSNAPIDACMKAATVGDEVVTEMVPRA